MWVIGLARSEEGDPSKEDGDAADLRLAAAAGVRGGEIGCGVTGMEPDEEPKGASVDDGVGSAAGG